MKTICIFLLLFITVQVFAQDSKDLINEFKTGHTIKYSSNGNPKSKGLNFSIKYPKSLTPRDGDRPNVVQKFFQNPDAFYSLVLVNKFDEQLSKADLDDIFSTPGLKSMIPETAIFVSSDNTLQIEGLKAAKVVFINQSKRVNVNITSINRNYITIYKNYLFILQFSLVKNSNETIQELTDRFDTYNQLTFQIFNSLIIENKWK